MKKTILKVLLVVMILVVMSAIGVVGATVYMRWEADLKEQGNDIGGIAGILTNTSEQEERECFTCLFMGVNGALTDFIMLGQYNPKTRDISLLSIPRDTNVSNSVDGKINSLYGGRYPEKVMKKVEEITGIKAQHYVVFNTKILREVVDKIGGVTVDVPINMNYDDPYQNLYIHLSKGTQKLTGKQAEQFVRFRKNNDGTGYVNGDVGRIDAQQKFIKATISKILSTISVNKVTELAKIVIDGTKTDITLDIVSEYVDDIITIKLDKVKMDTLPGVGRYGMSPYGYQLSYFYHDEAKTKELIKELFNPEVANDLSGDVVETSTQVQQEEKIMLEVLNAGATATVLNDLVEKLNGSGFDVIKIGNYQTTTNETSRIIDYGTGTDKELNGLKDMLGIQKVESGSGDNIRVKFSIIIGQNYK